MLVQNLSIYTYYLKNQGYPLPAEGSLVVDNADWETDDQLARTIESLDKYNYIFVSGQPDNYPRTTVFPEVINLIGVSADSLRMKTVTLTDDDIKALGSTRFELVPNPGAGKAIVPVSAMLYFHYFAGYSGMDASTLLGTKWKSGSTASFLTGIYEEKGGVSTFLDSGESTIAAMGLNATPVGLGVEVGIGNEEIVYRAWLENSAFYLTILNATLSGGHPSNTLKVVTVYNILDV